MEKKKYEINGKTYTQGPLVLGQLMPLCELIEGVKIPEFTVQGIAKALGGDLPRALAIVLVPEDESPGERETDALAAEFFEHMGIDTALEVVADFLSFNPVSSILERVKLITASFSANLAGLKAMGMDPETGESLDPSDNSSASLH